MKRLTQTSEENTTSKISKRFDKKGVNIRSNSSLFFQLGLIATMLLIFFLIEQKFEVSEYIEYAESDRVQEDISMIDYVIDRPNPKVIDTKKIIKREPIVTKTPIINEIKVFENDIPAIIETPISSIDVPVEKTPAVEVENIKPIDNLPKNVVNVEVVPLFPGCDVSASNTEKIDCFSQKINTFILKNFDADKYSYLTGKQRIFVQFKINTNGDIVDVTARANDKVLEKEAIKIIEKLPRMTPGKMGAKAVEVLYGVPIYFMVE